MRLRFSHVGLRAVVGTRLANLTETEKFAHLPDAWRPPCRGRVQTDAGMNRIAEDRFRKSVAPAAADANASLGRS